MTHYRSIYPLGKVILPEGCLLVLDIPQERFSQNYISPYYKYRADFGGYANLKVYAPPELL